MSNELVRRNLETSLSLGSLSSLVKASETVMLLIDTSGSMSGSPVEKLREVVRNINPKAAGIPMIAFGGPYDAQCRFVDLVPDPDGGTPLHMAIPMAKEYGANRVVVISDGCPDLSEQCIIEAKAFGGKIDVVYIGAAGDAGSFFLDQLAQLTGGSRLEGDINKTKELSGQVMLLLEGDNANPSSKVIIADADGDATISDIDAPDSDDDVDDSDSDDAENEFENADDDDEEDEEDDEED
jgi:hypothetical protein